MNLDAENQLPAEINLPVLPLRGETLFPISDSVHSFVVGREKSVAAIEEALSKDRRILVIGQQDPELEAVVLSDLYEIGTEASIVRMLKLPDGTTSVLVEGEHRVRAINTISEQPFLRVVGWTIEDLDESPQVAKDLMPRALDLFHRVVELSNSIPEDSYIRAINTDTPGSLADVVAASLPLIPGIHQEVLEIREVSERLALVIQVLEEEIRVLELEQTVRDGVRNLLREFRGERPHWGLLPGPGALLEHGCHGHKRELDSRRRRQRGVGLGAGEGRGAVRLLGDLAHSDRGYALPAVGKLQR